MATKKSSSPSPPSVVPDKEGQVEERRKRKEEATTVDGTESHEPREAGESAPVSETDFGPADDSPVAQPPSK